MKIFDEMQQEVLNKMEQVKDLSGLNDLRVHYLGKKGPIQALMKDMKDLPKEQKPEFGKKVNELKQEVSKMIEEKKLILHFQVVALKLEISIL